MRKVTRLSLDSHATLQHHLTCQPHRHPLSPSIHLSDSIHTDTQSISIILALILDPAFPQMQISDNWLPTAWAVSNTLKRQSYKPSRQLNTGINPS